MAPRNDTRFSSATHAASMASLSKKKNNIIAAVGVIVVKKKNPVDFAASDPLSSHYVTTWTRSSNPQI